VPKTGRVPPTLAELLPIATEAVDRAARMIRGHPAGHVTMKDDRDPATDVDYAIEREVRNFLVSRAPDVSFLGEEDGRFGETESELTWALDPIDGTVNFIHGLPLCGVSLGLTQRQNPVLGVVDLPFMGNRYAAVTGQGAFRNGDRIQASDARSLISSVVAIGDYAVGADADLKNLDRIRLTQNLVSRVERIRMLGSAVIDLCWVADGTIDASVMLANKPWDTVAGVVIARESGAIVLDRHGRDYSLSSQSTVAAAPGIRSELLKCIAA